MRKSFVRVGAFSPIVCIGNPKENAKRIVKAITENEELKGCDFVVTPELSLVGYTCQDMLFNRKIHEDVAEAIKYITLKMPFNMVLIVGAPFIMNSNLFNCAWVLSRNGGVIQIVPKINIPNYKEFYDGRYFTSGDSKSAGEPGNKIMIADGNVFGVEVCEDLWAPESPSTDLALSVA